MVIQAGKCVKCGALQSADARVGCGNPQWHDGYVEQERDANDRVRETPEQLDIALEDLGLIEVSDQRLIEENERDEAQVCGVCGNSIATWTRHAGCEMAIMLRDDYGADVARRFLRSQRAD